MMPLLPQGWLVISVLGYIRKKAWESYIFTRPDAQALACSPVKIEKYAEAHAYMATSYALQGAKGELSLYAGIYCGFS